MIYNGIEVKVKYNGVTALCHKRVIDNIWEVIPDNGERYPDGTTRKGLIKKAKAEIRMNAGCPTAYDQEILEPKTCSPADPITMQDMDYASDFHADKVVSYGVISTRYHVNDLFDTLGVPHTDTVCEKEETKETTMRFDTTGDLGLQQRNYLNDRLYSIKYEKIEELAKPFGMVDEYPHTPQNLIKMIQEGKFSLKKDEEGKDLTCFNHDNYSCCIDARDSFIWRDPSVKKDEEGYEKAKEKVEKSYQETKDIIALGSIEEGLKAMEAFKSRTFH